MLSTLKQIWAGWIGRALRFAILLLPVAWIAHNTDLGLIARNAASTGTLFLRD